jgi:hypothetical protein
VPTGGTIAVREGVIVRLPSHGASGDENIVLRKRDARTFHRVPVRPFDLTIPPGELSV